MKHIGTAFLSQREAGSNNNMLARFGKAVLNRNFNSDILNLVKTFEAGLIDKALGSPDNPQTAGNHDIRRNGDNRQIRTFARRQKGCQPG